MGKLSVYVKEPLRQSLSYFITEVVYFSTFLNMACSSLFLEELDSLIEDL